MFPRIVASAQSRDAFVCDYVSGSDRLLWDVPLCGTLRGGAERERVALLELLNTVSPSWISTGPPSLVWPLERHGAFSVKSLARELILQRFPGCPSFPSELIWLRSAPTKVAGFVWQVVLRKVSTIDILIRRGIIVPNRCVMCGSAAETIDHLFWDCSFASQVWACFSSRLSMFGPLPLDVEERLRAWKGLNCGLGFSSCVRLLFHGLLWGLWGERNNRIFRDIESTPWVVSHRIATMVGQWCVVGGCLGKDRFGEWLGLSGAQAPVGIG
ncbi:hypothetical protein LINPERHAP1_LOCUS20515 [Linum perenne]